MPPKKKLKIAKQPKRKSTQPSTSKPLDTDTEATQLSKLSTRRTGRTSPQPSISKSPDTDVDSKASQLSTLPTLEMGKTSPHPSTSEPQASDAETSPLSTLPTSATTRTSPQQSTSSQIGSVTVTGVSNDGRVDTANTVGVQYKTVDKNVSGVTEGGRADNVNTAAVQNIGVLVQAGETHQLLQVLQQLPEIISTLPYNSHLEIAAKKNEDLRIKIVLGANQNILGSIWTCITTPIKGVLALTSTCLSALCNLRNSLQNTHNATLRSVQDGSLIFVFEHSTMEDARAMVEDKDRVKSMVLDFIHCLSPDIEDITLHVEIRENMESNKQDKTDSDGEITENGHSSLRENQNQTEVDRLKLKVRELEQALEKMKQEKDTIIQQDVTDAKLMLLMRHRSSTAADSSSGYHSTHGDTESTTSTEIGDTRIKRESKENLPEESTKWMINDGEATLIYYDKNRMFFEACRRGSLKIVKELLASGADINHRSTGGWTPVMVAAYSGYKQLFDLLVQQGCDLSLKLDNDNNILHVACLGRNAVIVNYIISNNVESIDSKGQYGRTAVMKAANIGNRMTFDLLVSQGCDLATIDDTGYNILHLACFSDNVEIVDYILSHHIADINSKGQYGRTPVMIAAEKGHKKVFDLLVSQGCDLATIDDTGHNILYLACFGDNVEIVGYILSHHIADINNKGQCGRTPVMIAAGKGHKKVFDLLVSQGCDLATIDDTGNNILHCACLSDNVDIVGYILSHHIVDINSKGQYGRTPVMTAAENGRKNVFDLLMSQGCDLATIDDTGNNILHCACLSDNVDIVGYILSHHIVDINSKGQYGRTPVMTAAENGHIKVFDLLVSQGCDLATIDDTGYNILHAACFSDNVDIVGYILSHHIVDINSKGQYGRTPVMTAAEKGHIKVFDLLVSQGCDLATIDDTGHNILYLACFSDNVDIVGYILSHHIADINSKGQYGRTPVMTAAVKGQKKVFDLLMSQGCDLATIDDTGYNILHAACFSDNVDIVDYILSHHIADINSKGFRGRTPVMTAAENGRKNVFDLLVSQGCDLATIDDTGNNILHCACLSDNVDIVGYILSHHIVDINSKGQYGRTPVMTAAENGRKNVFDLLMSQGCDLATIDDTGNNILHCACLSDNVDIVGYILSHHIVDINSKSQYGRTPVMTAAENGRKNVFDLLMSQGCDLATIDDTGCNILHAACFSDNVDIVGYILSHHIADINSKGFKGRTPVMTAAENGRKKVFDLLMSQGCDLATVDDIGNNILHLACFSDNVDIVGYILSHHIADINSRGFKGFTPVMTAAEQGQKKVFDLLADEGCDLTIVDHDDDNILHLAAIGGSVDIVTRILSEGIVDINSRNKYGQTAVLFARYNKQNKVTSLLVDRGATDM